MGTRADFWLGRGADAEWLGSIQYDGRPKGLSAPLLLACDEEEYRAAVADLLAHREDALHPGSAAAPKWSRQRARTIDYSYTFHNAVLWACRNGSPWFDPVRPEPEYGAHPTWQDADEDWDEVEEDMPLDADELERREMAEILTSCRPLDALPPRGEACTERSECEWRGDRRSEDDWRDDEEDDDGRRDPVST